jgi:hypothetical protein
VLKARTMRVSEAIKAGALNNSRAEVHVAEIFLNDLRERALVGVQALKDAAAAMDYRPHDGSDTVMLEFIDSIVRDQSGHLWKLMIEGAPFRNASGRPMTDQRPAFEKAEQEARKLAGARIAMLNSTARTTLHKAQEAGRTEINVYGTAGIVQTGANSTATFTGNINELGALVQQIERHLPALALPQEDDREVRNALVELRSEAATPQADAGKARQLLGRVLGVVGKAGDTVLTTGIKVCVEAWMKAHGIVP